MSETTNGVASILTQPLISNEPDAGEELAIDQLAFHFVTVEIGNAALGAYLRLYAWCGQHDTGRSVTQPIVDLIAAPDEMRALVSAGLLLPSMGDQGTGDWELGRLDDCVPNPRIHS